MQLVTHSCEKLHCPKFPVLHTCCRHKCPVFLCSCSRYSMVRNTQWVIYFIPTGWLAGWLSAVGNRALIDPNWSGKAIVPFFSSESHGFQTSSPPGTFSILIGLLQNPTASLNSPPKPGLTGKWAQSSPICLTKGSNSPAFRSLLEKITS